MGKPLLVLARYGEPASPDAASAVSAAVQDIITRLNSVPDAYRGDALASVMLTAFLSQIDPRAAFETVSVAVGAALLRNVNEQAVGHG